MSNPPLSTPAGSDRSLREATHDPGCERHIGDPHNLCEACWALEPDGPAALEARADALVEYGNSLPDGVTTEAFAEAENLRRVARALRASAAERLVARAEWALNWLVKRIDHLDPGSQMVVPNHQQVMAGRVREALRELRDA